MRVPFVLPYRGEVYVNYDRPPLEGRDGLLVPTPGTEAMSPEFAASLARSLLAAVDNMCFHEWVEDRHQVLWDRVVRYMVCKCGAKLTAEEMLK